VSGSRRRLEVADAPSASLHAHSRSSASAPWSLGQQAALRLSSALLSVLLLAAPAGAVDKTKVGTCLLSSCQSELAACLADEKCAESLVCLNRCGDGDISCQIRCGDQYQSKAIKSFNACAVTNKKCVPQRVDRDMYPVPPAEAVVAALDVADLEGRWYITAGLNKLFDTFPCQVHYFTSPEAGKLFIKVNWRVTRPNGQFYERSDLQRFVQSPQQPGLLLNHGNEVLHYEDDWYVLSFDKEKGQMLVYYRGRNDAWDGYGGAVVYSRQPSLAAEEVPALRDAAAAAGLRWDDFVLTDNSCPPEPPLRLVAPTDLDALADDVEAELESFSRGFTRLRAGAVREEQEVAAFLGKEKQELKEEFKAAEERLLEMEREAEGGGWAALRRLFRFGGGS